MMTGNPAVHAQDLMGVVSVSYIMLTGTYDAPMVCARPGLEKAMEAKKRERALTKFREGNGMTDQVNVDLTYAVDFNLAVCYHTSKDYQEALDHFTGEG